VTMDDEVVVPVQPYAARKTYLCPGCDLPIPPGTYHLVVVPEHTPDLRRHWHRGCWHREQRRRHGRSVGRHIP
ncbi:MAG: ATP/GTP-binding protein, partial [Acidimicrobiia bacterium]|nr:ATP/GTP-binding protein [Acidimicrobiia bacterium]